MAKKPATATKAVIVFQFKITLLETEPPIWRRIQVTDCMLDKLHERIQTAMGWTNSHLHQFEIDGSIYGDPELLDDGLEDSPEFFDSRKIRLSKLLARKPTGYCFQYHYDFGDDWNHQVELEDRLPIDPQAKYPICIDGNRACPPEDVGGTHGYEHLLEVLANPRHKEYQELREWSGEFHADGFTCEQATSRMRKGLPDWRSFEAW